MLNKIAPLALVFALGIGSAATAATETGTLASIDPVRDIVTLTDGTTFGFADEAYADRLTSFKPGDLVSVSYLHVGTSLEATAISPMNSDGASSTARVYVSHGSDPRD